MARGRVTPLLDSVPIIWNSLERVHAKICELKARASHQILHGTRDDDVAGLRSRGHPRCSMIFRPETAPSGIRIRLNAAPSARRRQLAAARRESPARIGWIAPDHQKWPRTHHRVVDLATTIKRQLGANRIVMGCQRSAQARSPRSTSCRADPTMSVNRIVRKVLSTGAG